MLVHVHRLPAGLPLLWSSIGLYVASFDLQLRNFVVVILSHALRLPCSLGLLWSALRLAWRTDRNVVSALRKAFVT